MRKTMLDNQSNGMTLLAKRLGKRYERDLRNKLIFRIGTPREPCWPAPMESQLKQSRTAVHFGSEGIISVDCRTPAL